MIPIDTPDYITATHQWIERVVIGLQLCPFAAVPFRKGQIRYVVSRAATEQDLVRDLREELRYLYRSDQAETETSLLIHPDCLREFEDYWDFMERAEELIRDEELEGEIQLAGFHPEFLFAGTQADDAANYTNRSPFPMIHLLREESVTYAVDHHPDPDAVPEQNIQMLRKLGLENIRALRGHCLE